MRTSKKSQMWWKKYLTDLEKISKWRWGSKVIEFEHFYNHLQIEPLVFEELSTNHAISVTSNKLVRKQVFNSMLQTLKMNSQYRVTMYTLQLFCLLAKTNASFKDIVVILDVLAMYIAAYSHQFNIALRLCSIVELTFINSTAYSEIQLSRVLCFFVYRNEKR
jgi:hypothetical protein